LTYLFGTVTPLISWLTLEVYVLQRLSLYDIFTADLPTFLGPWLNTSGYTPSSLPHVAMIQSKLPYLIQHVVIPPQHLYINANAAAQPFREAISAGFEGDIRTDHDLQHEII
jgi:hypothetical protein